jgi:hypothetical protein
MPDMVTHARLLSLLYYDPHAGTFVWKERPRHSKISIGAVAGCTWATGRRVIKIDGIMYYAARLAWFYMTKKWPKHDIDHENRNPGDDRWLNLRPANDTQQSWNMSFRTNNTSGYLGVNMTLEGTWRAHARIGNRKKKHLGCFPTAEEAAKAYDAYVMKTRGQYAVTNF